MTKRDYAHDMSDGLLQHIPTVPDAPFPLGRSVVWHDPRNRQFRALLTADLPDRPRYWYSPDVFDQQGSSCTAQACIGALRTTPNRSGFKAWPDFDTEEERHSLYLRAQGFDPWPGAEPDYEGSSTDAPWKALLAEGRIAGYRWLFGVDELKQQVMHHGPATVGTNWYVGMFYPGGKGYLQPDGGIAGGHAWRVTGWSVYRQSFRMTNSWSKGWGQNGKAWVSYETMRRLLSENGEAVTA